ncbi:MAG: formylglycine-generating enzyme family protein [Rivularia sp. T60_A2020_040]|nr:formylglycine-generating enzyme family protein [Rivularia sp. T60_A2020_040]
MTASDELIKILDRILDGSCNERDIVLLRQSLQTDTQNQVQLAKNIVNIPEGRDIHIGDRTYYGTDAQTIKDVIRELLPEIIERVNGEKSSSTTKNTHTTNSLTPLIRSTPPPKLTNFEFEVVTVNAQGKEIKRCCKQAEYFTEKLGNVNVLEMVSIPGGNFKMGSPGDEKVSQENERPEHLVNIKPFFIGKYPITQAQWKYVANLPINQRELELEPSYFKGDNLPVERVSWYDAQEFCLRLSRETGRIYRLPSEAEWEYACRAKSSTPFHFGKTISTELANYCGEDKNINGYIYKGTYSSELPGIYRQQTTEIGSFFANDFGLYDMHGLVWEWCADYEHEDYLDAPTDGSVWVDNGNEEYRILRGGSWDSFPNLCRSASRFSENLTVRDKEFGFRVICD